MIEIPNICVPYIQRVCGSFIPKMRQAHENSSIHEPAWDRKRQRGDESDLSIQLSQGVLNDVKDISCQHEGIEDLRIKRRLRSHESRGVEPSFDPRVKVGTNQEPMDELRFSLRVKSSIRWVRIFRTSKDSVIGTKEVRLGSKEPLEKACPPSLSARRSMTHKVNVLLTI